MDQVRCFASEIQAETGKYCASQTDVQGFLPGTTEQMGQRNWTLYRICLASGRIQCTGGCVRDHGYSHIKSGVTGASDHPRDQISVEYVPCNDASGNLHPVEIAYFFNSLVRQKR